MIVVDVDVVSVGQPEDLEHFAVVAAEDVDVGAVLAASRWGWADDSDQGDVWIRTAAVRSAVEARQPPEWTAQFEKMLDFARSKGWLSADGESIRAHVEDR